MTGCFPWRTMCSATEAFPFLSFCLALRTVKGETKNPRLCRRPSFLPVQKGCKDTPEGEDSESLPPLDSPHSNGQKGLAPFGFPRANGQPGAETVVGAIMKDFFVSLGGHLPSRGSFAGDSLGNQYVS